MLPARVPAPFRGELFHTFLLEVVEPARRLTGDHGQSHHLIVYAFVRFGTDVDLEVVGIILSVFCHSKDGEVHARYDLAFVQVVRSLVVFRITTSASALSLTTLLIALDIDCQRIVFDAFNIQVLST